MTLGAMTYQIKIGTLTMKGVTAVRINSSVESLADTATIELPAYVGNEPYDIEAKIKRGMKVTIDLGYQDRNKREFTGYVRSISVNTPCLIECEDDMFLFRKEVKSEVFVKKSVSDILRSICTQLGFKLTSFVDDLKYDKFVIRDATGYEVLTKIQEQFRIALYIWDGELWATYQSQNRNGTAAVDYSKNIKASELKYVREVDVKVRVQIRGVGADNKATKTITAGEAGGEVLNLPDRLNVTDEQALLSIAKEELRLRSYTGYRGSLTCWGRPYVGRGFVLNVIDNDYRDRNGYYYVKSTEVNFSKSTGYERKIDLAERLA